MTGCGFVDDAEARGSAARPGVGAGGGLAAAAAAAAGLGERGCERWGGRLAGRSRLCGESDPDRCGSLGQCCGWLCARACIRTRVLSV